MSPQTQASVTQKKVNTILWHFDTVLEEHGPAHFFDKFLFLSRHTELDRIGREGLRAFKMVWMTVRAYNDLDLFWIKPVCAHSVKKGGHVPAQSWVDQAGNFAINEYGVTIVLSLVSPQINIEVFRNFHCIRHFLFMMTLRGYREGFASQPCALFAH